MLPSCKPDPLNEGSAVLASSPSFPSNSSSAELYPEEVSGGGFGGTT